MIGPTVCTALNGKIALKHPELGVLVREDGMVFTKKSRGWIRGVNITPKGYFAISVSGTKMVHRLVAELPCEERVYEDWMSPLAGNYAPGDPSNPPRRKTGPEGPKNAKEGV